MKNIYKDIPWFEWKYWVSKDWEVYRYQKKHWPWWAMYKWKVVNSWDNKRYRQVKLPINWKMKAQSIHRLVAITYIKNPDNKPWINHKNWIPSDNRVENLEWCTISENTKHWFDVLGRKTSNLVREKARKFCIETKSKPIMQLTKEWILCKIYKSRSDAERETGIIWTNISKCIYWKYKSAGWYLWQYVII